MQVSFTRKASRVLTLAALLALPTLPALAQQLPAAAQQACTAHAQAQGLSPADANALITSQYTDRAGFTHTYLLQQVNGLPVFGATGAVHTDLRGKVVALNLEFVPGAAAKAPAATPALTPEQAIGAVALRLSNARPTGLRLLSGARDGATQGQELVYSEGGVSAAPIPVRLMYAPVNGQLVLVWNVTLAQLDEEHYWNARVDAQTGQLLDKNDYTVSEQARFVEQQAAGRQRQQGLASEAAAAALRPQLGPASITAANALTVVALPLESPAQGARTAVPLAAVGNTYSPFGWQVAQAPSGTYLDSYSKLSAGVYLTRGNNVAAYDDYSNTANGYGTTNYNATTTSPDGGATLSFDFPFNQPDGARANLNAATTNLFYVNNVMHDVMFAHGFDEVAGNFQNRNIATTARALDQVRAESQDGFGRNNANFSTPVDGTAPLMQMYLWDNAALNKLTISAPSSVAGTYAFGGAQFGPSIAKFQNGVCANIVPVNDSISADGGVHACARLINAAAISGNIALLQRGGCTAPATNNFTDKVKFAQNAGAIAVIIYDSNTAGTTPLVPGGTDATITIPVVGISGADGLKLKNAAATATVAGCIKAGPDFDGSFDNGIVCHEYGHGISNRLTGGPANSSCVVQSYTSGSNTLYTQCMGEGWSDFFALWMTTKPGDDGGAKRYVGTYVEGQSAATGPGIRTYPYSTNMSNNPLTYGKVGTTGYTETHAIGEIWTATLWDLNWQLIARYGYNADTYASTGGNNVALKLVLDGCKLQICNPGFLDGRNAILKADSLYNNSANYNLIWTVFARRGMGYSATRGTRSTVGTNNLNLPLLTGITEAFDLPAGITPVALATPAASASTVALEAYPNPAHDRLTIRTQLASTAPVQVTLLDVLGRAVLPTRSVPAAQLQQAGLELPTGQLAAGLYVVRVQATTGTYTTKVTVQH